MYYNYADLSDELYDEKNLEKLSSLEGVTFSSFAKSGSFGKDLYLDWVAPTLRSSLWVQTWLNSRNPLPSNCDKVYR